MYKCPDSRGAWYTDEETGEVLYDRCRRNACPFCAPIKVKQIGRAIKRAKPNQLITFTGFALDDPIGARKKMGRLPIALRKLGFEWEQHFAVEPNPNGTGLHVHAWVRGDKVPEHVLATVCSKLGIGITPKVLPVTYESDMTYTMKRAKDDETRASHLQLNGGRLSNHTRGFYLNRAGKPCSLDEAMGRRRRSRLVRQGPCPPPPPLPRKPPPPHPPG